MVGTRNLAQYAELHRTIPYGRGGKIKRRVRKFYPDSELIDATNDRAYIRTWKATPTTVWIALLISLLIRMTPRIN
jgi:hypothetical protein